MRPNTVWLIVTMLMVAGAVASLLRWIILPARSGRRLRRFYLMLGLVLLVLAAGAAAITVLGQG